VVVGGLGPLIDKSLFRSGVNMDEEEQLMLIEAEQLSDAPTVAMATMISTVVTRLQRRGDWPRGAL
jgi:acetylglutamate kinase